MSQPLDHLRTRAVGHTLFRAAGVGEAVRRLGFVQADPIRAPAPAQDLILRQRVARYRVGDLERWYAKDHAEAEEGLLYAYGFLPRPTWEVLRPASPGTRLPDLERRVLEAVQAADAPVLPKHLDGSIGRRRARNAWGGRSRSSKLALERLQRRGLVRVAHRVGEGRCYAPAPPPGERLPPGERVGEIACVVAQVLAPVSLATLRAILARVRRRTAETVDHVQVIERLVRSRRLEPHDVEGVRYLVPGEAPRPEPVRRVVRFLAPFDPLVWDRERFEHLFGWAYRFEAYVPPAKRVRGYYAMPLLYGDRAIGWVNGALVGGSLDVEAGFVGRRPGGSGFRRAFDAEVARLERFLRGR